MKKFNQIDSDMSFSMHLCTRGKCEMIVNDKRCLLKCGDALIKSPLVQISRVKESEDFCMATIFEDEIDVLAPIAETNFDIVQDFLRQNKFYCSCKANEQANFLTRKKTIDEYKQALTSKDISGKQNIAIKHIIALLEQATILEYANIFLKQQENKHEDNNKERNIMIRFIFTLFNNYKYHRQVKFYADSLNFSANHFTRIIKKVSKRTPSEWISIITINQSKKLLRKQNISIKEVAQELNFPEQFTFRKYFKLYTGISPKEYKLNLSKEKSAASNK